MDSYFPVTGNRGDVDAQSCTMDALQVQSKEVENLDNLPLLIRKRNFTKSDGLWYLTGKDIPYEGVAVTYHPTGEMKTRTKFVEGVAIGLIEEWDMNGSTVGPALKENFPAE